MSRPFAPSAVVKAAIVVFLGAVLAFLFASAMARNLNHDEHQFVAPAVHLAREGHWPYRDFPLFHLPNLVGVYAAFFEIWDRPFHVARCFSVACAFAAAVLIFRESWKRPAFAAHRWRFGIAVASVLFLVFDPLFLFTSGRAWNHDSTALFILLAVLLQVAAARRNSAPLAAASAVCGGLAAGLRLTCAPILVPLWFAIWFFPVPMRRRAILAAIYFFSATAALAPSLYFLTAHTEPFLFGNFEFPRLRLLDPENERIRKTMHPLRKLRFFFKEVALPSLPLFLAFLGLAVRPAVLFFRERRLELFAPALVLAILPFALLGCFTPSRYQYQHYFIIIPLLMLGTVVGAATLSHPPRWLVRASGILLIANIALFLSRDAQDIWPGPVRDWFPNRIARIGDRIASHKPNGPILTLAPIFPQEAGLATYPEFATGPFAWKSARWVAPQRRSELHLISPDDLTSFLSERPPGAIFTGVEEPDLEEPLVEYAKSYGFNAVRFDKKRTLWLPPAP